MIKLCLTSADNCIRNHDYDMAISYLVEARMYARQGSNQRTKAIAVHCTAALQVLFPLVLEQSL